MDRSKDTLWFASDQSLSYLDGTLAGDVGFDPLGLSDPEGAGGFISPEWIAYAEVRSAGLQAARARASATSCEQKAASSAAAQPATATAVASLCPRRISVRARTSRRAHVSTLPCVRLCADAMSPYHTTNHAHARTPLRSPARRAQLIHARFAMIAIAGVAAPELLGRWGVIPAETALPWYSSGVIEPLSAGFDYWADPYTLFFGQVVLMGFAEFRRWEDYSNPGCQAKQWFIGMEGSFANENGDPVPGGRETAWPDRGEAEDPEDQGDQERAPCDGAEARDGAAAAATVLSCSGPRATRSVCATPPTDPLLRGTRSLRAHALLSQRWALGVFVQAAVTGTTPVTNLIDHLSTRCTPTS